MSPHDPPNDRCLEGKGCDVVISVDGVEFEAHETILCSCSDYFRALFSSGSNSAEKPVYKISGTSPGMMSLIINYAYTGTAPVTVDNVKSLLIAADQFNVMGIVGLCCEFLKSQLCLENCIGIWRLTGYYFCPDLRDTADAFILRHFAEVTRVSTELLDLSIPELSLLVEKTKHGGTQDDTVCEAVDKWLAHNLPRRQQHHAAWQQPHKPRQHLSSYFFSTLINFTSSTYT
uniref:BTB domain-containing protein n=1 Tax=Athene cunicularia TaxID=194338 RepID=A0A663M2X7_ATHCN